MVEFRVMKHYDGLKPGTILEFESKDIMPANHAAALKGRFLMDVSDYNKVVDQTAKGKVKSDDKDKSGSDKKTGTRSVQQGGVEASGTDS